MSSEPKAVGYVNGDGLNELKAGKAAGITVGIYSETLPRTTPLYDEQALSALRAEVEARYNAGGQELVDMDEIHQIAFEIGGDDEGGYQFTADELERFVKAMAPVAAEAAEAARIETALRDALQYVGLRTDGDLATLAERCELWMRESRVLIDSQKRLMAASQAVDLEALRGLVDEWRARADRCGAHGFSAGRRSAYEACFLMLSALIDSQHQQQESGA